MRSPLSFLMRRRGASHAPCLTGTPDWLRGGVSAKSKQLQLGLFIVGIRWTLLPCWLEHTCYPALW